LVGDKIVKNFREIVESESKENHWEFKQQKREEYRKPLNRKLNQNLWKLKYFGCFGCLTLLLSYCYLDIVISKEKWKYSCVHLLTRNDAKFEYQQVIQKTGGMYFVNIDLDSFSQWVLLILARFLGLARYKLQPLKW